MKFPLILLGLSFVHVYLASAKSLLTTFQSSVVEGESYTVEWLSDSEDYLELLLVRENYEGWSWVQTLFQNRTGDVPGGTYQWDVSTNLVMASGYGLCLQSIPTNSNGAILYMDLSEWFAITSANGSLHTTSSVSSPAMTASVTGSSFTSTRAVTATTIATTTATGTGTSQPTSVSNMVPERNRSLSKGAIVAICIAVGIAVGVIVGSIIITIFLLRRRHKAQAVMCADSKHLAPELVDTETTGPSLLSPETSVELPEGPRIERVEVSGQTRHPLEKDAEDVASGKKTIPPERPVELE